MEGDEWTGVLHEFLQTAVHAVLFVRNIYPHGIFQSFKKYQIPVKMCMHAGVQSYIDSVLNEVKTILDNGGRVQQVNVCIKGPTGTLLEQFVFDIQNRLHAELRFDDLMFVEQSFRSLLLKVYCCDSRLSKLPEDCTWSLEVRTSQSAFLEMQDKQLVNDVMWIQAEDSMPEGQGHCKIVPVAYVDSNVLQVQLYIQDMNR